MENKTVAIILAGGKSERMGVAKGLLKFNKTFWILEQIQRLSKSSIKEIYVGFGFDFEHYFWAIDWFEEATKKFVPILNTNIKVVINNKPELGSFSTLQAVLNKVENDKVNILLCPIDNPILNYSDLNKIINTQNRVVIPSIGRNNGHPIKIDNQFRNDLTQLSNSNGENRLDVEIKKLDPSSISIIEVSDNLILKNLNSPSDWKSYLKECK